ncbi:MAG TPA: class I SAM-dependent methyltransferase [Lysobacter sp.]|jgi:2-polyprenyl-3-methyl-5-hydroxy-6-metoxy-1,4-benzoquinol methylase|nr:class I SAM-dependent methyltransferase [Lysobacter sp.]
MQLSENERRDLHSGDYVAVLENLPISRLQRLLPYFDLRPDHRVVDFACGAGNFAELIHDRVLSVEGIDFSPDFVSTAQRRAVERNIHNVSYHCQDIVEFCSQHSNEYDVVTALDFSEHVYDEDFLRIFGGAYRILKPGGTLYVYTPNLDFFYERMKGSGLAPQFPQHIAVRDAAQNISLLQQCGFGREDIVCSYLPHFNVFRFLHPLARVPGIRRWMQAKLLLSCTKRA